MFSAILKRLQEHSDLQYFFYKVQVLLGILFGIVIWLFRPKRPESSFKVREEDVKKSQDEKSSGQSLLAEAKIKTRVKPLELEGIRLEGACYEILNIPENSTSEQIHKAYRELMKRYHPDRVGRPGTREWVDSQRIARIINSAKEEMLKKESARSKNETST